MKTISVLVPVYNNETTVAELHRRLVTELEAARLQFEIVFVNDGSSDRSWSIIQHLAKEDPRCVGLSLSRNFGQHPAISAGLARCRGEVTVLMDADLQDRPEELPRIIAELDDPDVDIVYTTWHMGGAKAHLSSRLFHSAFSHIAGVDLPSNLGTYRAFTRPVLVAVLDYPERGAVYGPLMAQMGFNHVYVSVERAEAVGRRTSYSFRRRLALATSAMLSYSSLPHRLVTWLGMTITVTSALYLLALVLQYLSGTRELVSGLTLLIGITLLMSGVLLVTVGVLSAYTYRVFQEVLARPRYHVARSTGVGLKDESD